MTTDIEKVKQQVDDLTKKVADSKQTDTLRVRDGLWLAGAGLFLTFLLIVVLLIRGWTTAGDIVAVVGAFTTLVGTLVGYFVGGGVGSQGKASSDQRANAADQRATTAERRATVAEKEATKGKDLDKAIQAKANAHRGKAASYSALAATEAHTASQADMDELATFSRSLFS